MATKTNRQKAWESKNMSAARDEVLDVIQAQGSDLDAQDTAFADIINRYKLTPVEALNLGGAAGKALAYCI